MKKSIKVALAAVSALVVASPAFAQQKPTGLSFRAGIFISHGEAESAEGRNWFTAGLDYKLKDVAYNSSYNSSYSISADLYGKGSWSAAPVLLNYNARYEGFYWTAGAGVAFDHTNFGGNSDSSLDFAYQLAVGKDFVRSSNVFFVELRYFGNNRPSLTGYSLVGGIRF